MHLRALIVLLLVMNLGVALWWALRPPPGPEPAPPLPADVPRLQLLSEVSAQELESAALNAANADVPGDDGPLSETGDGSSNGSTAVAADPPDLACFAFGPWTEAGQAAQASALLQPLVLRLDERQAPTGVRGWRVMLPPLADREAAQAEAARLSEAGFDDHFIIAQGEEANAIALGRFGSEPAARRHEAALREAGFRADAEPLGATGSEHWIDVAAGADFDPDAARQAADAARSEPLDCAQLP